MKLFGKIKCSRRRIRLAAAVVAIIVAFVIFGLTGEKDSAITVRSDTGSRKEKNIETGSDESRATNDASQIDAGRPDSVQNTSEAKITVDISGQVAIPGVYTLEAGARLADLCEAAGGLTSSADLDAINRAGILTDGQKVYIPEQGENLSTSPSDAGVAPGLVNINTANIDELQRIPGVGPVTASRIIEYRDEYGGFGKIEDIKNVSGIGEKTFLKMKPAICV